MNFFGWLLWVNFSFGILFGRRDWVNNRPRSVYVSSFVKLKLKK